MSFFPQNLVSNLPQTCLKKVITNFIEKATAINKYQYQFNPRSGDHSFATINPKKSPAKPISLVSMNGQG